MPGIFGNNIFTLTTLHTTGYIITYIQKSPFGLISGIFKTADKYKCGIIWVLYEIIQWISRIWYFYAPITWKYDRDFWKVESAMGPRGFGPIHSWREGLFPSSGFIIG